MSKLKDDTLYCARCGISFLWTIEEQHEQASTQTDMPTLCPGCRHLLPQGGRERGLVKWYSMAKRYGFIARAESHDLFVHASSVNGQQRLRPSDLVEFTIGETARGPAAQEVEVLRKAD